MEARKAREKAIALGEDPEPLPEYKAPPSLKGREPKSYFHRTFGGVVGKAVDGGKLFSCPSFLLPGSIVRHKADVKLSSMEEDPLRVFLLMFAPIGCFFFKLRSSRGESASSAVVIPTILNLQDYSQFRLSVEIGAYGGCVSHGGHAALQVLAWHSAQQIAWQGGSPSAHVYVLGTTKWNSHNPSFTWHRVVRVQSEKTLYQFSALRAALPPIPKEITKDVKGETIGTGVYWLPQSVSLELFLNNVAEGLPFYTGFSRLAVLDKAAYRILEFNDHKGLAIAMKELLPPNHQLFVAACHQALSAVSGSAFKRGSSQAQAGDSAEKKVELGKSKMDKTKTTWRLAIAQARTPSDLRRIITTFWSKAGTIQALQGHHMEVWPFLNENWKEGRDLALLALASYQSRRRVTDSESPNGADQQDTNDSNDSTSVTTSS